MPNIFEIKYLEEQMKIAQANGDIKRFLILGIKLLALTEGK